MTKTADKLARKMQGEKWSNASIETGPKWQTFHSKTGIPYVKMNGRDECIVMYHPQGDASKPYLWQHRKECGRCATHEEAVAWVEAADAIWPRRLKSLV